MEKAKKVLVNAAAKASVFSGVAGSVLFGLATPVSAQWVPDWVDTITNVFTGPGARPVHWAADKVRWALTILFIVVFVVAVIYAAMAAMKFISSQGDASKLEESKAAVKAILMGFAAMIIALVGIFVIFWIFGASGQFANTINNVQEIPQ